MPMNVVHRACTMDEAAKEALKRKPHNKNHCCGFVVARTDILPKKKGKRQNARMESKGAQLMGNLHGGDDAGMATGS